MSRPSPQLFRNAETYEQESKKAERPQDIGAAINAEWQGRGEHLRRLDARSARLVHLRLLNPRRVDSYTLAHWHSLGAHFVLLQDTKISRASGAGVIVCNRSNTPHTEDGPAS